jgi:hypothetical protein
MKIDKRIMISDKRGYHAAGQLSGSKEGDHTLLHLHADSLNLQVTGIDFFECLQKLRMILEANALFILCQGSAKNVHHSGMSRDMSDGLRAYSLEPGKRASLQNLVDIFDAAPAELVCTINEQEAFFKTWIGQSRI